MEPRFSEWLAGRKATPALLDEWAALYGPPLWQVGGGWFDQEDIRFSDAFFIVYGIRPEDIPRNAGETVGEAVGSFVATAVTGVTVPIVKEASGVLLAVVGVIALLFLWKA